MTNKKFAKKRKLKASDEINSSGPANAATTSLHVGSNVSTITGLASTVDADMGRHIESNSEGQIAGYIFMCNTKTKPDCFTYRVFGLPAAMIGVVEKIKPKTKLFLYDFEVKLLYGLYVADSVGTLTLEPHAFGGRYPAQVKFSIAEDCLPLPVAAFKDAIGYTGSKFKQELSYEQVDRLVSLFRPIIVLPPHQPPPSFHGAAKSQYDVLRRPGYHHVQEVPLPGSNSSHSRMALARGAELSSDPYERYMSARPHQAYYPDYPDVGQHDTHGRYGHMPQISLSRVVPPPPSANRYYGQNNRPPPAISLQKLQAVAPSSAIRSSSLTASHWVAMAADTQNPGGPTSTFKQIPSSVPGVSHDRSGYTEAGYGHRKYPNTHEAVQVPTQQPVPGYTVPGYIQCQGDSAPPHTSQLSGVNAGDAYLNHNSTSSAVVSSGHESQPYSGYHQEVNKVNASGTHSTYAAAGYVNQEYPTSQVTVPEGTVGYGHADQGYGGYYQPPSVTSDQGVANNFPSHAYGNLPASSSSGYYQAPLVTGVQGTANNYPAHAYENLPGASSSSYYQARLVTSDQGVANNYSAHSYENHLASSNSGYYQAPSVTGGHGVANNFPAHSYANLPGSSNINYVQSQGVPALSQVAPSGSGVAYSNHPQG